MAFTDQKPFIVTDKDLKLKWGGGFWCKLCGHKFVINDTIRWVFANGGGYSIGNFFTCQKCDGEDVKERAQKSYFEAVKLAKQWGIYGPDWQKDFRDNL